MHTACEKVSTWRKLGLKLDRVAVNLFPPQLRGDALLADISDALRASGLPADILELEITENVALTHDNVIEPMQKLRGLGVKIAFDDFGTGYASLSYLRRLPLSSIKIDCSFIRNIADNPDDAAIVRSLIVMAHNLRLAVLAEGVETSAQAEILRAEGCEGAQGFLFAKPLPAGEFEEYLRNSHLAAGDNYSRMKIADQTVA